MTIEEIEQTLQVVAENQARFSTDIGALREQTEKLTGAGAILEEAAALHQQVLRSHESRQAKLEEAFRQVAESNQAMIQLAGIHEERLDEADNGRRDTDEKLNALIDAQIGIEARQARLEESQIGIEARQAKMEESFRQVAETHAQLVEMLRRHEERHDGHDERINLLLDPNGSKKGGAK